MNCAFNLDNLPVAFGTALSKKDDHTYDRNPLNGAIRGLAEEIWKIGGFRFRHRRTHWDRFRFDYICCQDVDCEQTSVTKGKRDSPRMERFNCEGRLILTPSLEQRTMDIRIHHCYHVPYPNWSLSSEVIDFILEKAASSTPADIFQQLQTVRPTGWETTAANGNSLIQVNGDAILILFVRRKICFRKDQILHHLSTVSTTFEDWASLYLT